MKILCISDTHCRHRYVEMPDLSDIDVLVHSGDITGRGELDTLKDFAEWFSAFPVKHKICIFGNHEVGFQHGKKRPKALKILKDNDINYLENSSIVIDNLKFYGSPVTPFFYNWEWNYNRGKQIAEQWAKIPNDVNILVTHGPPHGILDLVTNSQGRDPHQGCEELAKRLPEFINLKCHIFGHLHFNGGKQEQINGVQYVNAAMLNDSYLLVNKPQIIEI